jgi:hypothetical protein
MQRREFIAAAGVSYNKRMARPVCKSFRVSCLFQSAVTYPASRLCPEPRWRFAHPGPHNYLRRRAPFVVSGFRNAVSTVRPSRVHRSQTSSGHRRVALCFADCLRQTNSQIRRRGFHAATGKALMANFSRRRNTAQASAPACWLEQPRPRSCAPARAGPSPSVRAACLSVQDAAEPPARHGSASCADICCRAC